MNNTFFLASHKTGCFLTAIPLASHNTVCFFDMTLRSDLQESRKRIQLELFQNLFPDQFENCFKSCAMQTGWKSISGFNRNKSKLESI